jgi:hypothetical protein
MAKVTAAGWLRYSGYGADRGTVTVDPGGSRARAPDGVTVHRRRPLTVRVEPSSDSESLRLTHRDFKLRSACYGLVSESAGSVT